MSANGGSDGNYSNDGASGSSGSDGTDGRSSQNSVEHPPAPGAPAFIAGGDMAHPVALGAAGGAAMDLEPPPSPPTHRIPEEPQQQAEVNGQQRAVLMHTPQPQAQAQAYALPRPQFFYTQSGVPVHSVVNVSPHHHPTTVAVVQRSPVMVQHHHRPQMVYHSPPQLYTAQTVAVQQPMMAPPAYSPRHPSPRSIPMRTPSPQRRRTPLEPIGTQPKAKTAEAQTSPWLSPEQEFIQKLIHDNELFPIICQKYPDTVREMFACLSQAHR